MSREVMIKEMLDSVENLHNRLNDREKEMRLKVLNAMIDCGGTLNISEWSDADQELIYILKQKNVIVLNDDVVEFAYPVSGMPTNHKVSLENGKTFRAMCAIDAMGAAFTFHQNMKLESICASTGEAIFLEIKDGKIAKSEPEDIRVIHVDLNKFTEFAGFC